MHNFIHHILGTNDVASFAAAFFFALIGVFLSLRLHANKRDTLSPETPYRFSWKFLFLDNIQRIVTSILLVFIGLRFSKELLGVDLTMYFALLVGFGLDKISEVLKNVSFSARK